MANNMEKYKQLFIAEAQEKITLLNASLLGLEKKPSDSVLANNAMRASHTLKSSAAAMNFTGFSHLAHAMENLFEKVRSRQQALTPEEIAILFECADAMSSSLTAIKNNKSELDVQSFISRLQFGNSVDVKTAVKTTVPELAPIETIKVNVKTLGTVMSLTEELMVALMRLKELLRQAEEKNRQPSIEDLKITAESLNRLTGDLQYNVTNAHLVPLEQLFEQFPRIVRDLASTQGKTVEFSMSGSELALDRSVVERLGEPLIHLIRNAVDHGIEGSGKIILSAERLRDSVVVSVHNDGKPIDWKKVVAVAVKKGFIVDVKGKELLSQPVPQELEKLLYKISTKDEVTETSGRGVGLTIIRSVIESLGGKVRIESKEKGTSFILTLPLTVAIVQALLSRVANHVFALPFTNVDRLVRVPLVNIKKVLDQEVAVVDEEDIPIIRLAEHFAISLGSRGIFLSEQEEAESRHLLKAELMIVTKQEGLSPVGLVVDEVLSEQSIIVKPLRGFLKQTKGFAGVTLLGDGRPALILDVATLR